MPRAKNRLYCTVMLMSLMLSTSLTAQKTNKGNEKENAANLPLLIWRDPGDVASLNLLDGAGGKDHAPDPNGKYTFVKEIMAGHSPKFDVQDAQGVRWRVKMGEESHSEVAATRLLWAAGYFVDEDYYVEKIEVVGVPKLHRGGEFVSSGGTVRSVRLERHLKEVKKVQNWSWFDNPFLDKQELNGLRVMMALLNNWDLQAYNNSVYEVGGERRYLVSDVGATFGKTGNNFARSKSVLKDYANSKFVKKGTPEFVDFAMESRPFAGSAINVSNYKTRTRMESITKHVPRADAKWLAQRLSQLSEEQIRDSFRAAGYTAEEVEGYTRAVQKKIVELNEL
jgi:hypothetical protein